MSYDPPPFTTFRVNTLNLDTAYSTLLGRYKVVEAAQSNDLAQQTSLEVLIARTNEVIKCKTDRESQREVFNQLVNELRQISKEDKETTKQGTLFLLGALIHRYFRLIEEYDGTNGYISWSYWGCPVTNCKLFLAIRRALQFKEIEHIPRKKFREDDLKILDAVTIVRALEVFRDNMLIEDKDKIQRYMKYPHFAQDTNFKTYLQNIIDEQTRRAAPMLQRFKAITFVQSLVKQMDNQRQQLEIDIDKWCKSMASKYKDFNNFKLLEESAINSSLDIIDSERSRNIIFSLFYTPLIQENLKSSDHTTFLIKMKECYYHTCSHMLFGGYALLLQQSKLLGDNLLFTIQKVLNLEFSLSELTNEDMLNGIKFLKQFFENEPTAVLDCEFFGGRDKMDTFLARTEKELTQAIIKETPERIMALTH